MTEYVEKEFIQKNSVEKRDYQINLASQAINENCIVVLPTGLGKTTVALHVISEYLAKKSGTILFLAPTRVLVNQHFDFLKKNLTIDDTVLITGEDSVEKRTDLWNHRIICATPEVARNDMNHNVVKSTQFNLVIFDEVHRTTGDYAYSSIAEHFENSSTRILGMTATLPSEQEKATEILKRLQI
ncbi:MAG: DEAD/DEAH box helicase, partial [Nitrosopumilus sp.]